MMVSETNYEARLANEWDSEGWRNFARRAIAAGISPEKIRWQVAGKSQELSLFETEEIPPATADQPMKISKAILGVINTALIHSDPHRFDTAYRAVWEMQRAPQKGWNPANPLHGQLQDLAKSVRRDIHKMHAFVRFRKTGEADGREQYVAWFEPDHHIVDAVAPFFRKRFTGMDWVIVTPERTISWDGAALGFGPGGRKADVPSEDAVEAEWRSYYANIFNPARVKVAAMQSEMPKKYWKNLPEADLIAPLLSAARARVEQMQKPHAEFAVEDSILADDTYPQSGSLTELYECLEAQEQPAPAGFAQNIVRGEGPENAKLMFLGEQPGDQEDQAKRNFVGPAGQLLMTAFDEVGLSRQQVFLTNSVKRFKFVQRGKRRIHQTPSAGDIDRARWWVQEEIRLVQPQILLALGASAARSLTGRKMAINANRGRLLPLPDGKQLLITVHPSYLLRLPDDAGRDIEYRKFVRDLELAVGAVGALAA